MIERSNEKGDIHVQARKKFTFFDFERLQEKIDDPLAHPIKLRDLVVHEAAIIGPRILLLDKNKNKIFVFVKNVQGSWSPYSGSMLKMTTNQNSEEGILLTYGQDAENQSLTGYIKLWRLLNIREDYENLTPLRRILVGQIGRAQRQISYIHFLRDMSLISIGSKKGMIILMQSKSILQYDPRISDKMVDKKQIKILKAVKRKNQTDIYFTTEESFFWFENLSEKRRIMQNQAQNIQVTSDQSVLVTFKGDTKTIHEFKGGKEIRNVSLEGQKKFIKEFRKDFFVVGIHEKRNEKNDAAQKYILTILDVKNQFYAYTKNFARIQQIFTTKNNVLIVGGQGKGERSISVLTEKDNSFKVETLINKSDYSEVWKFAKNQKCDPSLLAEISRLHADTLYNKKNDSAGAMNQYILTLGYVEPSYVIRKYLDVSQTDYLIMYLEKIHEKKIAKKQHTALLLNCYVKKQKIQNLSRFLSESSIESDLFDIETAIKVCRDLKHYEQAMKLAQQKNKHELYLKILIEDKPHYEKALEHIKNKVDMEEKEKYLIEFGQLFMKFLPQKTINLIKMMVRVHSISELIRTKGRDYILTPDERGVLEDLNFNMDELENLPIITFKKPDQYFSLFLIHNEDLQNFLSYLIRQIPKLPHQQIVFHRLIQFYLEAMKMHPQRRQQCQQKILDLLRDSNKKCDRYNLLALFKMYDFDNGIITLCKKLGIRDDLLNFYISKNKDEDILQLCRQYGREEVNLWINALKYFAKPEYKKQFYLSDILEELCLIQNLSPLPILSILSKNKNIPYQYVKQFFLSKLRRDREVIQYNRNIINKNMRQADSSREDFKKLKTTSKAFQSNTCMSCRDNLTFPSVHFMCGHSFHENCIGGDKDCSFCEYEMRNIIERKEKYAEGAKDQRKLFEALEERKSTGFEVISQYLGKGLFSSKNFE